MSKFHQQVLAWQRKAETAMTATLRESAQDLTEDMLQPRAKGGRLPVDTGALRNSFVGAINSIPRGPSSKSDAPEVAFDMQPLLLSINRVNLGDRLTIGTAMNYAKWMEARYSYLRSAAQNWPQIAERAANRVRRAIR